MWLRLGWGRCGGENWELDGMGKDFGEELIGLGKRLNHTWVLSGQFEDDSQALGMNNMEGCP